jgi:hypothetical protein
MTSAASWLSIVTRSSSRRVWRVKWLATHPAEGLLVGRKHPKMAHALPRLFRSCRCGAFDWL